jgi:putative oxidoreductase
MFRYLQKPHVELARAILRITLGFAFFAHGYIKLHQSSLSQSWTDMLTPSMQQVIGWGEFICGVCLIFGFLSRVAALVLIADMIGAIALVMKYEDYIPVGVGPHGNTFKVGYEYNILIIAVALAIFLVGSGWFSLDAIIYRRWKGEPAQEAATGTPHLRADEGVAAPVEVGQH